MAESRGPTRGLGAEAPASVLDLRPHVLMPGLVDLHAHLPQIPNAGLGSGLDLLTWLDRYIFPLERAYDRSVAERQAPLAFRAFAAAGTTTVVAYAALWEDSTDAAFAAAEAHGIRAVIGKVMMDRLSYDTDIDPGQILETSLRQSDALASRWHGRDDGRLSYAFTPRFAVSCSAEMLRESAAPGGASWRVLADAPVRGRGEMAEVARLFPELATISTSTTAPAHSARARSSRTPSTSPPRGSGAWWRATRAWRTARHRTCSCRAA